MFHSFLQSRSFVFGYLKKCWAKVQFELDRRAYIKAKRLMDNAIEVITLPPEFGGGRLFMDFDGRFFIVEQQDNRVFNLKVERLSHQIAAELAFTANFNHIDLKREGIENTLAFLLAEKNFCYFFGNSEFRHLLGQAA